MRAPRLRVRRAARAALLSSCLCCVAQGVRAQATLPVGFEDQLIAGGFDFPTGMAALPDGRILVIEQKSAKIRLLVNGALSPVDPVCVVDAVKTTGQEQGLLGIAVDPGWPSSPYIYIHCDDTTPAYTIRISRYTVTGDLAFTGNGALSIDVASRYDVINSLPDAAPSHNGGTLRFGPDQYLYDSMGDDAGGCAAQDDSSLRGVILRLDVSRLPAGSGGPPALDLITPPDNPQVFSSNARTRLIDAFGLRNPFRFTIDSYDGALYIGDVGESSFEEVDSVPPGGGAVDFGWSHFEALSVYDANCDTTAVTHRPIWYYDRSSYPAAAVTAGVVYRAPFGATHPFSSAYDGDLFVSDYYVGFLRRLKGSGQKWSLAAPVAGQPNSTDWATGMAGVSDYFIGGEGAIYYCRQHVNYASNSGQIRRIVDPVEVGVPQPPPVSLGVGIGPSYPEPARGALTLPIRLSRPGLIDVTIFDATGRRVRHLLSGAWRPAGSSNAVLWDGFDDERQTAPAGIYLARLSTASSHVTCRVTLLR